MPTLRESVADLWASLCRAGDHWHDEALLVNEPDGSIKVVLKLRSQLPEGSKKDVSEYIRGYLQEVGHRVRRVKITKRYAEIIVSNS
jgi:hypothetical protein